MQFIRTHGIPVAASWMVVMCLAHPAASPAAFDIPDSCRAGTGTYSGSLTGEMEYSTCIVNGVEKIDLRFKGNIAKYGRFAVPQPQLTALLYGSLDVSDSGMVVYEDFLSTIDDRKVRFTAQFANCGITGTWEIFNDKTLATVYNGTFALSATGPGTVCDPAFGHDAPVAGGGGGTCGLFGGGGLLMAAPLFLTVHYRRKRSYANRPRSR